MRADRDEYRRDWTGSDWRATYSTYRRPKEPKPLIEWTLALAIGLMLSVMVVLIYW